MMKDLSLEDFLVRNRIHTDTWAKANIEWPILQAIAAEHEAQSERLGESAKLFASEIQKFNKVHSVRWRVKDSEHLLGKIVRKRADENEKYKHISPENYYECVTDLVGIRALHLFKEDCLEIDIAIRNSWELIESPLVYVRDGDGADLIKMFQEKGFEVKIHPAGYRSVHYVFESVPNKRKIITEVQVRTIFEEGWSEIDHKVRYPNFSDNAHVLYFLAIFNRLAGNADEMGGFVLGLVADINRLEEQAAKATEEKEATLRDMEQALSQLESVEKQNQKSKDSIAKLKAEVAKLKEADNIGISMPPSRGLSERKGFGLRGLGLTTPGVSGADINTLRGLGINSLAEKAATQGLMLNALAEQGLGIRSFAEKAETQGLALNALAEQGLGVRSFAEKAATQGLALNALAEQGLRVRSFVEKAATQGLVAKQGFGIKGLAGLTNPSPDETKKEDEPGA